MTRRSRGLRRPLPARTGEERGSIQRCLTTPERLVVLRPLFLRTLGGMLWTFAGLALDVPTRARSVFVTAASVARAMSLEDRDWYRAEMARRRSAGSYATVSHQPLRQVSRWRVARTTVIAAVAVVAIGLVLLPATMDPRCDLDSWTSTPVEWSALSDRVSGNMAASRGWPVTIVQSRDSDTPPPPALPNVIRPSRH